MTIWWCQEHEQGAPYFIDGCSRGWDIWCASEGKTDSLCRIIQMRLDPVTEPL